MSNQAPQKSSIRGTYEVVCREGATGREKWRETIPNMVTAQGKEWIFDSAFFATSYTSGTPYLGLIAGTTATLSAADTLASHAGWTEFSGYTVDSVHARGEVTFGAPSSAGSSPASVTTMAADPVEFVATATGNVYGCLLVTGDNATSTIGGTAGVLYSTGAFAVARGVLDGDVLTVTYSTTLTS